MSSLFPAFCSQQPAGPAAWRCLGCARTSCPECAELLEVGSGVDAAMEVGDSGTGGPLELEPLAGGGRDPGTGG